MTDIEDLKFTQIKMPVITDKYSEDEIKRIDEILSKVKDSNEKSLPQMLRKAGLSIPVIDLLHRYHQLVNNSEMKPDKDLEHKLIRKKSRGTSGVEVIAVSTFPEGKFHGCPKNCHYCPDEPSKDFDVKIKSIVYKEDNIYVNVINVDDIDKFHVKVISMIYYQDQEIKVIKTSSLKNQVVLMFHTSQFSNFNMKINDIIKVHKTAQPRSYVSSEPAVARANQNGWDCVSQFRDIAGKRIMCGHNVTKVEGIVIGGTWSYYPSDYQEKFIRDFYFAANTLYDDKLRERKSLEEEIEINQLSVCRVIGLTLETRPDFITKTEIKKLRRYNCTRVQIGIQHINDAILSYINRDTTNAQAIKAVRMLKEAGFKVDIHLMPDLPGSNFKEDVRMMKYVLETEHLQADQWKIYPCQTMEYTEIKRWYEEGTYKPYFEEKKRVDFDNIYLDEIYKSLNIYLFLAMVLYILVLPITNKHIDTIFILLIVTIKCMFEYKKNSYETNPLFHLLIHFIPRVPAWIRLNRIVRDNPSHEIVGGLDKPHYRNIIEDRLKKTNTKSWDIREREIKSRKYDPNQTKLIVRKYKASGGIEYFISFEDIKNNYLLGFTRLRIQNVNKHYINALSNSALIRELHVYGWMKPQGKRTGSVQHRGFGQKLVRIAEVIAKMHNFNKVAIISGVGVREYYQKKLGYNLEDGYMTRELSDVKHYNLYKILYKESIYSVLKYIYYDLKTRIF